MNSEKCANTENNLSEPITHVPLCDVIEQRNGVKIIMDLPGVSAGGVDVDVKERILKVSATSPLSWNGRPIRYRRDFQLSDDIDCGGIAAKVRNGVLELRLPKLESASVHKIKVVTE